MQFNSLSLSSFTSSNRFIWLVCSTFFPTLSRYSLISIFKYFKLNSSNVYLELFELRIYPAISASYFKLVIFIPICFRDLLFLVVYYLCYVSLNLFILSVILSFFVNDVLRQDFYDCAVMNADLLSIKWLITGEISIRKSEFRTAWQKPGCPEEQRPADRNRRNIKKEPWNHCLSGQTVPRFFYKG